MSASVRLTAGGGVTGTISRFWRLYASGPNAWCEFGYPVHRKVSQSGKYRSQVVADRYFETSTSFNDREAEKQYGKFIYDMNSSADSAAERAMEYMELRRRIQELRTVEADLVEANKEITRLKGRFV